MTITTTKTDVHNQFEQAVLKIWHNAHGQDSDTISSTWGEERIVVMLEGILFKAEQMLAESRQGREVLERYVHKLLHDAIEAELHYLSDLLGREILSFGVNVSLRERLAMLIFRF
ncbi:MAG: Na-translocating system protein MpsC family protein [Chloroflexota bacterium]